MSESDTMDSLDLYDHLQTKSARGEDNIPETVEELNRAKKQLIEDQYALLQKAFLIKALRSCDGNISRAAEKVGMKRPNFHSLMRKYNLKAKG
jgi:two-component system NtrC family response regulator